MMFVREGAWGVRISIYYPSINLKALLPGVRLVL